MIPYLLYFCFVVIMYVIIKDSYEGTNLIFLFIIVSLGFLLYLFTYGFTEESRETLRIADEKQHMIDRQPITSKTDMGNGCTLNYYYGNGQKYEYTAKFVRCENSKVDTELKYTCGTSKAQKTCTSTISTLEATVK